MIPLNDGDRAARKAAALAQNKSGSGPIGYKEAGCATFSFYDAAGDRLIPIRRQNNDSKISGYTKLNF